MATTKVISPGGFPELLRRSRFASFDPTIRQSYGTPPSHLHRGNWGLKRPIAQRKRNAFISLKNFEEHEHYIEWNNVESQVRLIDKIEEINVAPKLVPQVPWFVGLGPAASSHWSRMDTEFAPGESGLGQRGKGEYGMKPSTKFSDDGYLHPNVRAMPPRVFNRYLKKLRSLRPQFKEFLKENGVSASFRETGIPLNNLHIRFLGQHFEKQFQDTRDKDEHHPNQAQPIRQQPHRLGGLMYASPTGLESFFSSTVQPGIVLEDGAKTFFTSSSTSTAHLVSTAGIIGRLDYKRAGPNVKPAFNKRGLAFPPATLLAGQTEANTFINVKVTDLQLERPPVAVTAFPSDNSSKEVTIRMNLTSHSFENDHWRTNTHPPGSMLYNAPEDSQQQVHTKNIFSQKAPNIYNRNQIINKLQTMNKLREKGSLGNEHHNEEARPSSNSSTLSELEKLKLRPRRDRWQDDQWVELPNTRDDGDSGHDNGNTNV